MAPDDAKNLIGLTRPVELLIKPIEGNPLQVTNLWVLNVQPGPNPFISEVVVADRRWMWSYGIVVGYYNMRRAAGIKRLIDNTNEYQVNFDRAFDIAYARFSLINGNTKFVAFTMLADVMNKVADIEKRFWGKTFRTKVDDRIGKNIQNLPLEDVAIQGIPGDQAVNIARAFLPEAGVRVEHNGDVTFFSRASRDEEKVVSALMPEIWGEGHTDLVKNSIIRPKEVHVLFTRKVEVRFDFLETAQATPVLTSGTVVQGPDEPLGVLRQMENVLPSVDNQLEIKRQPIPQGAWIAMDDAFLAWGRLPIVGPTSRYLDHDLCQRAFIPQMDLWAALQMVGSRPDGNGNLKPWIARIAAVERNYRTTFRLNRQWMDKFLSWDCRRLATIDIQSGQFGPSLAYGDYALIPSQRLIQRNIAQGLPGDYAINKSGYPGTRDADGNLVSNGVNHLDSTAIPGPGIVEQVDHDQGIIHIDYAMDLNRTYEMVLPSQIQLDSMPTADLIQRTRPIAWNSVVRAFRPPRLSPSFRLAVIITAVPASPNGAQQLHRIVVKPSDVASLLPEGAKEGIGDAKGPIMEIRIGAGREVARIAWDDTKSDTIEKIFGLKPVGNDPKEQEAFSRTVSDLCLNEGSTGGKAGASLNDIAKAEAAALYASLTDRYEGSMTGYLNGGVTVAGWANEVEHNYATDGTTTTKITMPKEVPKFNMLSFLSSSERAVLLRLAKP